MKTSRALTCLLLTLFLGTTAMGQRTPTVYISGTTGGKSKVISNMGQTYNYSEPIITSLGANKSGVFALARTRNVSYDKLEQNTSTSDWGQHWYTPRWNLRVASGGVVYNNNSVYKKYLDPNWSNEDFYSSLVMKVSGSDIIIAGIRTRKYKYDKNHNYHIGFESMQIGEVNKLSVFKGSWQHQPNAGKYSGKRVIDYNPSYLKQLRPMVWHITDCAYYDGKIYAVGCKEHDGSAWNYSHVKRESYYNHRAQIWENGKDYMQVSSGDYSSSWANAISIARDKNRNRHFYTCGYKWQPTQLLYDDFIKKGTNSHKVTQMGLVWRDKSEITKLYEKKVGRQDAYPFEDAQIDKQVVFNYGYGYYLIGGVLYEVRFNENGSFKSKQSVIGGSKIEVLDICFPGIYRDGGCYALVNENGEDKVYKVTYGGKRELIKNFGRTGLTNKLIAVCEDTRP